MSDKPILILIPALMCDERLYAYQINKLGKHCNIKVITLTTFDNITEGAKDILNNVIAQYPKQKFFIAGTSMGGYIAMEMLKLQPQSIAGICLINTTAYDDNQEKKQSRLNAIKEAQELLDAQFKGINDAMIDNYLYNKNTNNVALIKDMVHNLGRKIFINQQKLILSRQNYIDVLNKANVKTFIISAQNDNITPASVHQEMHNNIPNSKLFNLQNCGHLSPLDKPEDVTNILIELMNLSL